MFKSNEMKLITALCDALGFDVEVTEDYQEQLITFSDAPIDYPLYNMGNRKLKSDNKGMFIINDENMYTSMLIEPEVSYNLIKRSK